MLRPGEPPRANAELYSVTPIPHESKASTASQRGVLPHRATNAAQNGLSGTHTWTCAGKRTTYRPACGRARRPEGSHSPPWLSNSHAGSMRVVSWPCAERLGHIAGDGRQVRRAVHVA